MLSGLEVGGLFPGRSLNNGLQNRQRKLGDKLSRNKNAASGGQTGNGSGQILFEGFKPKNDSITEFEARQGTIASVLLYGCRNAMTAREIARIAGISTRQVTERIRQERAKGAPILSDTLHGFWLAEDAEEVRRCAAALHSRAGEIHRTARALDRIGGD